MSISYRNFLLRELKDDREGFVDPYYRRAGFGRPKSTKRKRRRSPSPSPPSHSLIPIGPGYPIPPKPPKPPLRPKPLQPSVNNDDNNNNHNNHVKSRESGEPSNKSKNSSMMNTIYYGWYWDNKKKKERLLGEKDKRLERQARQEEQEALADNLNHRPSKKPRLRKEIQEHDRQLTKWEKEHYELQHAPPPELSAEQRMEIQKSFPPPEQEDPLFNQNREDLLFNRNPQEKGVEAPRATEWTGEGETSYAQQIKDYWGQRVSYRAQLRARMHTERAKAFKMDAEDVADYTVSKYGGGISNAGDRIAMKTRGLGVETDMATTNARLFFERMRQKAAVQNWGVNSSWAGYVSEPYNQALGLGKRPENIDARMNEKLAERWQNTKQKYAKWREGFTDEELTLEGKASKGDARRLKNRLKNMDEHFEYGKYNKGEWELQNPRPNRINELAGQAKRKTGFGDDWHARRYRHYTQKYEDGPFEWNEYHERRGIVLAKENEFDESGVKSLVDRMMVRGDKKEVHMKNAEDLESELNGNISKIQREKRIRERQAYFEAKHNQEDANLAYHQHTEYAEHHLEQGDESLSLEHHMKAQSNVQAEREIREKWWKEFQQKEEERLEQAKQILQRQTEAANEKYDLIHGKEDAPAGGAAADTDREEFVRNYLRNADYEEGRAKREEEALHRKFEQSDKARKERIRNRAIEEEEMTQRRIIQNEQQLAHTEKGEAIRLRRMELQKQLDEIEARETAAKQRARDVLPERKQAELRKKERKLQRKKERIQKEKERIQKEQPTPEEADELAKKEHRERMARQHKERIMREEEQNRIRAAREAEQEQKHKEAVDRFYGRAKPKRRRRPSPPPSPEEEFFDAQQESQIGQNVDIRVDEDDEGEFDIFKDSEKEFQDPSIDPDVIAAKRAKEAEEVLREHKNNYHSNYLDKYFKKKNDDGTHGLFDDDDEEYLQEYEGQEDDWINPLDEQGVPKPTSPGNETILDDPPESELPQWNPEEAEETGPEGQKFIDQWMNKINEMKEKREATNEIKRGPREPEAEARGESTDPATEAAAARADKAGEEAAGGAEAARGAEGARGAEAAEGIGDATKASSHGGEIGLAIAGCLFAIWEAKDGHESKIFRNETLPGIEKDTNAVLHGKMSFGDFLKKQGGRVKSLFTRDVAKDMWNDPNDPVSIMGHYFENVGVRLYHGKPGEALSLVTGLTIKDPDQYDSGDKERLKESRKLAKKTATPGESKAEQEYAADQTAVRANIVIDTGKSIGSMAKGARDVARSVHKQATGAVSRTLQGTGLDKDTSDKVAKVSTTSINPDAIHTGIAPIDTGIAAESAITPKNSVLNIQSDADGNFVDNVKHDFHAIFG